MNHVLCYKCIQNNLLKYCTEVIILCYIQPLFIQSWMQQDSLLWWTCNDSWLFQCEFNPETCFSVSVTQRPAPRWLPLNSGSFSVLPTRHQRRFVRLPLFCCHSSPATLHCHSSTATLRSPHIGCVYHNCNRVINHVSSYALVTGLKFSCSALQ